MLESRRRKLTVGEFFFYEIVGQRMGRERLIEVGATGQTIDALIVGAFRTEAGAIKQMNDAAVLGSVHSWIIPGLDRARVCL